MQSRNATKDSGYEHDIRDGDLFDFRGERLQRVTGITERMGVSLASAERAFLLLQCKARAQAIGAELVAEIYIAQVSALQDRKSSNINQSSHIAQKSGVHDRSQKAARECNDRGTKAETQEKRAQLQGIG